MQLSKGCGNEFWFEKKKTKSLNNPRMARIRLEYGTIYGTDTISSRDNYVNLIQMKLLFLGLLAYTIWLWCQFILSALNCSQQLYKLLNTYVEFNWDSHSIVNQISTCSKNLCVLSSDLFFAHFNPSLPIKLSAVSGIR